MFDLGDNVVVNEAVDCPEKIRGQTGEVKQVTRPGTDREYVRAVFPPEGTQYRAPASHFSKA